MSWHERSDRQVGAEGINELREWLELSAAADAAARPGRAHVASLLVLLVAIAMGVLLGPTSTPAAASPLAAGTYRVAVDEGTIVLTVDAAGRPDLTVTDGLRVTLAFDDDGRVLDEFVVATDDGPMTVDVAPGATTDAYTVTSIPTPVEAPRNGPTDADILLPGNAAPDEVDAEQRPTGRTGRPAPATGSEQSDQARSTPAPRATQPARPPSTDQPESRSPDRRPATPPGQASTAPGQAPADDHAAGERPRASNERTAHGSD